jgi:hypothetical protein
MPQYTYRILLTVVLLLVFTSSALPADTLTITARQTVVRAGPDGKQAMLATVS